jgi:quercetin dioxygenase-like cupin family protein
MRKRDRKNLAFLLATTPESLLEWYGEATEDDKDYAMELLAMARQQLTPKHQHPEHRTIQ